MKVIERSKLYDECGCIYVGTIIGIHIGSREVYSVSLNQRICVVAWQRECRGRGEACVTTRMFSGRECLGKALTKWAVSGGSGRGVLYRRR
jgi:hypothetical protein